MNPLTGIFNKQRKASSILSPDPLEAEILSTVWMIANEQEQKRFQKSSIIYKQPYTIYDMKEHKEKGVDLGLRQFIKKPGICCRRNRIIGDHSLADFLYSEKLQEIKHESTNRFDWYRVQRTIPHP